MTSHELPGDVRTVLTYRGTVYPWQCDHMGHMNVTSYIGKFDEASWQLLSGLGLTASRFRKERIGMAAVEQRIVYKRELFAGDAVTIHSSLLEVNEKSMRILHKMTDDETGEVAAVTVIVAVHLDAATRKARALPSDVRDLAAVVVCGTCGVDEQDHPDHQLEMTGAGADRSFSFGPLV